MRALDTSEKAAAVQEESLRRLGPAGRLKVALELSDFTHALAISGIRMRKPGCNEEQARHELALMLYGPKV
jgi:hypothetical protein